MTEFTRELHGALLGRWNLTDPVELDDGEELDDGWYLDGWYLSPGAWSYGSSVDLDDGEDLDDGWYLDGLEMTSAGVLTSGWAKILAGTLSAAGSLARETGKSLGGTLSTAGSVTRGLARSIAGTLGTVGALARLVGIVLAGTLASSGGLTKLVARPLAGTLIAAGALLKTAQKGLAGTLNSSGGLSRETGKTLSGDLTVMGILGAMAMVSGVGAAVGALRRAIMGRSPFRIDVKNSSGNVIGSGPLATVMDLWDRDSLDLIGACGFSLPASDPMTSLIQAGVEFEVHDQVDGYIGNYLYDKKTLTDQWGEPTLRIDCKSVLQELAWQSVYFRRSYDNMAVDEVVAGLVSLAAGWNASPESGIGNTTLTLEGESVLAGVDALRETWNKHWRLLAPRTLEFGSFGESSGVRLVNLRGQIQAEIGQHDEVAIVESISLVEEAQDIWNKIIPLGQGQGVSQLTIQGVTPGTYETQTGTNPDGSSYYYIEDSDSVAAYGTRTRVVSVPQVRPVANTLLSDSYARAALKYASEAYLTNHKDPQTTYAVTVRGLRRTIRPGQTVRLCYKGRVDGYDYIEVDEDFVVTDVERQRAISGQRTARLTISTLATRRKSDTDVIADVVNDLAALKVHVPATLAYSPVGPYTKRIDSSNTATFTVRLGNEVLGLNYAILRVKTYPLRSSISSLAAEAEDTRTSGASSESTTQSGGGSTPTTSDGGSSTPTTSDGGGSTPTTTATSHQHTTLVLGSSSGDDVRFTGGNLYCDTPGTLYTSVSGSHDHDVTIADHNHSVTISDHNHSVTISAHSHGMAHTHQVTIPEHNHAITYGLYEDSDYPEGITVTVDGAAVSGGPWGTGSSVEFEVDITALLTAGTLRSNHPIVFSCTGGQGEIEAEVDMLVTIQAIQVS